MSEPANKKSVPSSKDDASLKHRTNMHVFIDTNILLNFFHFSKDELDALNDVFASHEHGAAKVYLTQQVCDEFRRNRESKIMDALKRFNEVRYSPQLPSFMKGYEEYQKIKKLSSQLQNLVKEIKVKVDKDITDRCLLADRLIKEIFSRSEILETTPEIFALSSMRIKIGNPPGKNRSIGDAINWLTLLESVPKGSDLHVISEDGDFYSILNEDAVHPFLEEEWSKNKKSSLFVYRTLSAFLKEHFDGVAFSFDKAKDALIEDLSSAGSFFSVHQLIGKLEAFSYFSLKEVERILAAALENDQFGGIVMDYDVSDFLNRVAVPRLTGIAVKEQRDVLEKVIKEQGGRAEQKA
ncbi:MAG: PIN domain-containing protein [Alphaproteobacteria bacterium]